jgi:hypothetical protein
VVERSVNPNDAASWTHVAATSKRTYVVQGLAAWRIWFRAAAVGAMAQGAWSDPATCVVT